MTTSQPVHPELREVGRRPFGVYAIIFLFVLFGAVAAFDIVRLRFGLQTTLLAVSYTHLRAHEPVLDLVCRLLLEKKNTTTHHSFFSLPTLTIHVLFLSILHTLRRSTGVL